MYPNYLVNSGFFKINLYGIFMALGIILCLVVFLVYAKKAGMSSDSSTTLLLMALCSIAVGIFSATLFQSIFNFAKSGNWEWGGMTFLGGLIGGVGTFFIIYPIVNKFSKNKLNDDVKMIVQILPACVCVAAGFGRIGCFFAGCCYGKPTDGVFGVQFKGLDYNGNPVDIDGGRRLPTQLFEFVLDAILFGICTYLFFKHRRFSLSAYLVGYGIGRIILESMRDDDRGGSTGSPSTVISALMIAFGILWIGYEVWRVITGEERTTWTIMKGVWARLTGKRVYTEEIDDESFVSGEEDIETIADENIELEENSSVETDVEISLEKGNATAIKVKKGK